MTSRTSRWLLSEDGITDEIAVEIAARGTRPVTRLDGRRAAATSVHRNRAVLFNALEFAVELGLLNENPLKELRMRMPRASHESIAEASSTPLRRAACSLP